ncbi:TDP-N-acetylfucosamine:lipid II N-acetylfucosaminyltransferase [Arenibacter antarcticus]|uniref:TDP-N-acetylfucosamine:lipid II N-acetylfucosaminyltransferase n=1 Tax=Arenibacter antarcticus TaxID=2040469 RepID=A0ABW5VAX9_9FLAO|nr:TDP-N-acetylfucosamine:lipid II N-acetylfucosaminyltransferase [Arenibacter sp. H213]MCM4167878.1 hypothetical protein [Arenibacter sp. H213]
MIVHFVLDEKVSSQIIENFGKGTSDNFFIVFSKLEKHSLTFIKNPPENLICFNKDTDDINDLVEKINPTSLIIHAFHLEFATIILKIQKKLTIVWYTWGFDIYGLPNIKPNTYAPITNKYLLERTPHLRLRRFILKNDFLRKVYFSLNKKEIDRYSIIFRSLKRVDYMATYLKEDFLIFSKYYPNHLKFIYCPFSTIDQYVAGIKANLQESPINILVGNSNSPESNHLDVFRRLKGANLPENTKIFTPLSYGDDEHYKEKVLQQGKYLLDTKFVPLIDFMERSEYISILTSCSCGVFYHYRQQAMGNIIAMLYIGSRVYMSKINPAFSFFISNNIKVYDFDEDFEKYTNTKMEIEQIRLNRLKLESIFGETKVIEDINKLMQILA